MAQGAFSESATAVAPSCMSLLYRATMLLEQRDFAACEATCEAVLADDAGIVEIKLLLGLALGAQGRPREAALWLDRAARARPSTAHPSHTLTGLLETIGQPALIVAQYAACLSIAPDDVSIRVTLAERLHQAGEVARAVFVLQPVIRDGEAPLAARILYGIALADLGRFAEALDVFALVVRDAPDEPVGWTNLGMMLKIEGRFDEAVDATSRAVALSPGDPQIRLNRAMTLLRAGRLAEAWDDYDARLHLPGRAPMPAERLLRDLHDLPRAGASVLVLHDCGFGDTLHFIRYAAALAARGARVIAWMPHELERLIARVPGVAEVVPADALPPEYDFFCHATDLPRICRATVVDICPEPYLFADPARVAHWSQYLRDALGERAGLRIGLVWAGQARPWLPDFDALDSRRSMTLADQAPLARVPGMEFVNLQKGPPSSQARTPPSGMSLHDPMALVTDFADTAALVANLDVVVSVDTSMAHLAGGMGKSVLLLDRYDSCWRWFSGREDSPWYGGVRIIRQERPLEWGAVIQRAVALLSALADRHAFSAARSASSSPAGSSSGIRWPQSSSPPSTSSASCRHRLRTSNSSATIPLPPHTANSG